MEIRLELFSFMIFFPRKMENDEKKKKKKKIKTWKTNAERDEPIVVIWLLWWN